MRCLCKRLNRSFSSPGRNSDSIFGREDAGGRSPSEVKKLMTLWPVREDPPAVGLYSELLSPALPRLDHPQSPKGSNLAKPRTSSFVFWEHPLTRFRFPEYTKISKRPFSHQIDKVPPFHTSISRRNLWRTDLWRSKPSIHWRTPSSRQPTYHSFSGHSWSIQILVSSWYREVPISRWRIDS